MRIAVMTALAWCCLQGHVANAETKYAVAVTRIEYPEAAADGSVTKALEALVATSDAAGRRKAADALIAACQGTFIDGDDNHARVAALRAFLLRESRAPEEPRRAVLTHIGAAVPDKTGKFSSPGRESSAQRKANDDLDWLAALDKAEALEGMRDVYADVVALRALAASHTDYAADVLFATAFADATMMYRDECGRFLRKMAPASLPTLTRQSQADGDRRRYATYQLERLDRQEPGKALASAASDEAVQVAILRAFQTTHHREAVHAVFTQLNADSPRIRAAARAAWMDYVTGPPPKPAPKKKLQLAGGKTTKKEQPLWLTYRELAEHELRTASDTELAEPLEENAKVNLEELSQRLFAHYDSARRTKQQAAWAEAKSRASKNDVDGAVAVLRQVLANEPDHPDRDAMSSIFAAHGKAKEGDGTWQLAAESYAAAADLSASDEKRKTLLAAHYYALGKAQEATGKDGGAAYRNAMALRPQSPSAQKAAIAVGAAHNPRWMLGAAAGLAGAALVLAVLALRRRRA